MFLNLSLHLHPHAHDLLCLRAGRPFFLWCSECRAAWSREIAVSLSLLPDFALLGTPINLANEEDGRFEYTDAHIDEAAWHGAVEDFEEEP